jgi:hypothetical protein
MKRGLVFLALVAACSGRDQSLGETTRPRPIIIDPTPQGGSGTGAAAGTGNAGSGSAGSSTGGNSGGSAGASSMSGSGGVGGTEPAPSVPPCEDRTLNFDSGFCLAQGTCKWVVESGPGYECGAGEECCTRPPGCGANGCGNDSQGGNANDPIAGAGGN